MRTDSFSSEKHLPVRRFIADESKVATGLYGPRAIADDLDNLCAMFDPETEILGGEQRGGISEKNIQDGAVSYDKLSEGLKKQLENAVTRQESEETKKDLLIKITAKAEQADTLLGYGISDAYTKSETDDLLSFKQTVSDNSLKTKDKTVAGAINEVRQSTLETVGKSQWETEKAELQNLMEQKLQKKTLYEITVQTEQWSNQPIYEGVWDSTFNTDDFYYVTLKDVDGSALPNGRFKLMNYYGEYQSAYGTLFCLDGLNTGNAGVLKENTAVEFISLEGGPVFRHAGVESVKISVHIPLNCDFGTVKIQANGQYIKTATAGYFCSYFITNQAVSNYHSYNSTQWDSESTKSVWHYVPVLGSFKDNSFMDEFSIESHTDSKMMTRRNVFIRKKEVTSSAFSKFCEQTIGFSHLKEENTSLSNAVISCINGGYIRNGSTVTVTEVK